MTEDFVTKEIFEERTKNMYREIKKTNKNVDKIMVNHLPHIDKKIDTILDLIRGKDKDLKDSGLVGMIKQIGWRQKVIVGFVIFILWILFPDIANIAGLARQLLLGG